MFNKLITYSLFSLFSLLLISNPIRQFSSIVLNGNKQSLDALYEYTENAKDMSKVILSEDLGRLELEGTYEAQFDEFIKEKLNAK